MKGYLEWQAYKIIYKDYKYDGFFPNANGINAVRYESLSGYQYSYSLPKIAGTHVSTTLNVVIYLVDCNTIGRCI